MYRHSVKSDIVLSVLVCELAVKSLYIEASMIGVEQWRASIGLYHPGSHHCISGERQLAPIYHLVGVTLLVLILVKLLVCCALFIIWIWINGYSLLKGGLTRIMASNKRTQLLVYVCAIRQAVMEAHSGCLERSVRAMVILLIMAGDVEQNPGPLPPASASPESRALCYHSASLITVVADPLTFSWKLFSTGLIEKATKDKANLPRMTDCEKNDVLITAVMSRVDTDPRLFHTFVDLLKDNEDDILKSLGGKLEDTYNEFSKGDTEQCTLSPPPAKQPELSPSHIRTQPSQPPPQPSYSYSQPSQPPPPPNLEPYNFDEFQMHLPHSHPPHLHRHSSQPPPQPSQPHPLPQPYTASHSLLSHLGLDPYNFAFLTHSPSSQPHIPSHLQSSHSQSHHSSHPPPSQPQPPHAQPSQYYSHHLMYPHPSPMHPHTPHSSTTHTPPPPPTKHSQHSPPPPPPAKQCPFQLFISFLRSFYNSEVPLSYCKWPPVPKKRKKYINLAAISREEVSSEELREFMLATLHGDVDQILMKKAPIEIGSILDSEQGEMLHCVLVEGAPGVGKTTLAWEICKRWARGELFQQYSVVMLLRLRDQTVQKAENIKDLIHYTYDDEDEDSRTNISQHMKHTKGKDTLIIFEGLDELPKNLLNTNQPSIFTRLLSRKILPDATILVTSRPSVTAQLRKGWEISQHIEVLGFTERDITNYIQNAMPPQELSAFDSYLSTNPNIRLTMYIPLNCAIVIEVYRSCQQSSRPPPKTTTELYTCLVQTILVRYLDSHPDYKDSAIDVDKFTDLPPPVKQHFYKLIQMAYDGVRSQQLIFHDQQKTIEHLGFMDAVTELFTTKHSATYSYNFLHLSLQEYLAAYYISLQSVDVQQQLLQSIYANKHLRNMGRFLAGITKYHGMNRATVKAIIEQECEKDSCTGTLTLSPYTLQLLHESGDYSIINGHSSYCCKLTDYSPLLDFAVLGHCIANSNYQWKLELGDFGQWMQSTNRIAMLVRTLNSHSNPSYSIEWLWYYYDTPECVQHLLLELPQYALQQTNSLGLCSNANHCPLPLPVYEHILSKMSRLHKLKLYRVPVSTTDAVALAELIKNNNTLQEVELWYNAISAEGVEALEKTRETKKHLKLYVY